MDLNRISVKLNNSFSFRKGIKKIEDYIQTDNINPRTKNKLINCINELIDHYESFGLHGSRNLIHYIFCDLLALTEFDIPRYNNGVIHVLNVKVFIYNFINNKPYNEAFDLLEGILDYTKGNMQITFGQKINKVFEDENCNFRVVDSYITDIISEEELESVNDTLKNNNVRKHFEKALEHLYKTKDYANSFKESMCALEQECKIITGDDKATLGEAIKKLNLDISPALVKGYSSIYGFASDQCGIRHANGIEEKDCDFELSKFFLISISAFINYIESKINQK